jgi:peptidyl-prolyl cis-trans isomerase C
MSNEEEKLFQAQQGVNNLMKWVSYLTGNFLENPYIQKLNQPILGPITGLHICLLITYTILRTQLKKHLAGKQETCTASHILVKTEQEALALLKSEKPFEILAKEHSMCPSKSKGGSLGTFGRGQMVPEFDRECFNPENQVGELIGPVKSQFGYHIIKISARNLKNIQSTNKKLQ